jgi:hypothetical protein
MTNDRPGAQRGDDGFASVAESEASLDVTGFIARHARAFLLATVVVGLLTCAALALAMALPATNRTAVMNLTPTFPGAREGRYPNRAPFSPQDLVATSVVEPVWRAHGLESRIELPVLLRNLQVRAGSTDVELVLSEFQQKLSNSKLTAAERTALESELAARLRSMTSGALVLSLDVPDGGLASDEVMALLGALPVEWARASDAAGARAYDFPLPNGQELVASAKRAAGQTSAGDVIMHAERMKEFMDALASSIREMSKLPGSDSVRDERGASVVDLGHEVTSIRRNMVIPLYIDTLEQAKARDPKGYAVIRDTRRKLLESELKDATERAKVIRSAFEDYASETRMVRTPSVPGADDSRQSGILANVDGTFIDRVIEQAVKSRDVEYRRELTDRRLQAELDVVEQTTRLEFETWLEQAVDEQSSADRQTSSSDRLQELTDVLAGYSARAREIMQVLAARNLNSASSMFRVDIDPYLRLERQISPRAVILAAFGTWATCCAVIAVICAARDLRAA